MAIHWKAYHLNKMIQDALRRPECMQRLMTSPEEVFSDYKLNEEERIVFRAPSKEKLRQIGVHPIFAMVYMIPSDEKARKSLTISPELLNRIKEA
jgi:hypothetical protein